MQNTHETDVQFLAELTKAAIESARVYPDQETVGEHEGKALPVKNILGFTAIRPAGLKAYPVLFPASQCSLTNLTVYWS